MKTVRLVAAMVAGLVVVGVCMTGCGLDEQATAPESTSAQGSDQAAAPESTPAQSRETSAPRPKPGDVRINPKDGAEMVWVPAGEFLMGSTDEEGYRDERPQRKVYLDGYWMYRTEVTVAQYRKFCEATNREMPEAPDWGWKEDHPVVLVTWQDAADYAQWAGVSLPTEAQWEKAARGTDGRVFPWGNEWDGARCANSVSWSLKGTKPVGSYPSGASPYGCLDMLGNVWEWCADWYDEAYYGNEAPSRNPPGPAEGGARVLRGGSWSFGRLDCFRCAYRYYDLAPDYRSSNVGFRCSRTP